MFFVPLADQEKAAVAVLPVSPRPFVDQKEVAVAVLRGPSRPFVEKRSCRCSCRSPWPSVSSVDKRCCSCSSSRSFAALRGKRSCRCSCRSPWPSVSSVDKRCCSCSSSRPFVDQKEVAVAVLRGPPCPLWTKGVAVAVFRGPSWIKRKLQLLFSVALRVLRGQKVLPLQFFAALRGSK